MTDASIRGTVTLPPVVRGWRRISPALVPILAVVTALLITVPFMIVTGGRGDINRGLGIVGTAYTALLEGSIGITINDLVSRDNLDQIIAYANSSGPVSRTDLRFLGRAVSDLTTVGVDAARRFGATLAQFEGADDEALSALAASLGDINSIGVETLEAMRPLLSDLDALPRSESRALVERYGVQTTLSADDRAAVESAAPNAVEYNDADLLRYLALINGESVVRLARAVEALDGLRAQGIDPASPEAADLAAMAALGDNGVALAREAAATVEQLDAVGIANPAALAEQIELTRALYEQGVLTNDDVTAALNAELDTALANTLVVRRPGNRLLTDADAGAAGVIYGAPAASLGGEAVVAEPEAAYLRLGGSSLLFFPASLEGMLVRAIPFIIAGLAVALAFKAGMFNIGAEGQLYIGGILAVWVGVSPLFADLPPFIHLPLMIIAGMIGGALWGALPGALKAYTGAHEVIVTIMLNYIAIRLVDWLIKSTEPVILLDVTASTPRTPFIHPGAVMPRFDQISPLVFIAAGLVVMLLGLWSRRAELASNPRVAVRPVVWGALVALGGLFLSWITVRGALHFGFVIMLAAVWFTDWFLNRTTLGFELRTVGTNPNAAKYAGMSVARNIIFAMALSGLLAGLAGTIEISGVQLNMQPEFFSGLGFDAIAVALLARTNPRNMIAAGLLWGALLTGAGLMQVRASISIDLVRIIQALIIMFIAADMIIRYLWRVPKTDERGATIFTKGWGS